MNNRPIMWHQCTSTNPPDGIVVMTMIADPERNVQPLKRKGNLWWFPDGSMYVYYVPTHWAPYYPE